MIGRTPENPVSPPIMPPPNPTALSAPPAPGAAHLHPASEHVGRIDDEKHPHTDLKGSLIDQRQQQRPDRHPEQPRNGERQDAGPPERTPDNGQRLKPRA